MCLEELHFELGSHQCLLGAIITVDVFVLEKKTWISQKLIACSLDKFGYFPL